MVTGLFIQPGDQLKSFLLATLRAVAFAVFVDDGFIFCVTENNSTVFSGVSLCACHAGLLLIVVPAYISK